MLTATNYDWPALHTRSRTAQCNVTKDLTPQPKTDTVTSDITKVTDTPDTMPKLLTEDRLQALLQIQRADSFCKCISKDLSNKNSPKHKADLFLQIRITIQTCHGFKPEILSSCHTKIMEIHHAYGST